MRVTFGKELRVIHRATFLDNAVDQEMTIAPDQDDVPATDILHGNLPDQGDILRAHPGLHARAMNAQGNPAVAL